MESIFSQSRRRKKAGRKALNAVLIAGAALMVLLALVPLIWIVGYVTARGLASIDAAFFTQLPRPLGMAGGGVVHAIQGTILLIVLAAAFSIPPGLLAAFYLAHYPSTPLSYAVRFGTDVLAGVPSIVIGLFGYTLIVKAQGHYSALAGGIALAIIMLPTIVRTTEEMIKLVPSNLREASLALGGTDWVTSLRVILPAAANGILTGFLLAVARASGETAPLLFTALGNEQFDVVGSLSRNLSSGRNVFQAVGEVLNQPVDSLPLTLWKYAQQPFPERVDQAWAIALVLMVLILAVNIFARVWLQARSIREGNP